MILRKGTLALSDTHTDTHEYECKLSSGRAGFQVGARLTETMFFKRKTHSISFIKNSYNAIYCKIEQLLQAFHESMNLLIAI